MRRHLGGAMGLQLAASTLFGGDIGNSSATAPTYILESLVPGFGTARTLIWSWSGIDITYIVTWCLLLVGLERGGRYVWEIIYESVILQYCVSTVSIAANEPLNDEILSYMSSHVVSRGSRFVAAQSARSGDDRIVDPYSFRGNSKRSRLTKDDYDERTPPVKYFPALGTHWFWFSGRPFMFQRGHFTVFSRSTRSLYTDYARGGEPLVIMCFGRDLTPLKNFLQLCKEYAAEAKREMTTIHIKGDKYRYPDTWGQAIARPARPLETINMDEGVKSDIVKDVDAYMHPSAREFYASRGIPFRRGYLFYGPPGTGKTSFSLAIAGHCKLDLYMLSLANGSMEEDDLTRMFASLPPRCVVLLEDIDSAGIKRESYDDNDTNRRRHHVSLSGLLNAIDGTSSQEGRLLIMTSNNPDALDKALVRPGRIDKKVYFGPINKASAEQIFLRMFTSRGLDNKETIAVSANGEVTSAGKASQVKEDDINLVDLAKRFAESIPAGKFTPAEMQGFLLANRTSPTDAIVNIDVWVASELANQEREREKEEKNKKKAAAKKRKRAVAAPEKPGTSDSESDDQSLDEELEIMARQELTKEMVKRGALKEEVEKLFQTSARGKTVDASETNGVCEEQKASNPQRKGDEDTKIVAKLNGVAAEEMSEMPPALVKRNPRESSEDCEEQKATSSQQKDEKDTENGQDLLEASKRS